MGEREEEKRDKKERGGGEIKRYFREKKEKGKEKRSINCIQIHTTHSRANLFGSTEESWTTSQTKAHCTHDTRLPSA